jgi:hypothetical protein
MAQAASGAASEIALIEKPVDHVRRNQLSTEWVKMMSGRKLKPSVSICQRSLGLLGHR